MSIEGGGMGKARTQAVVLIVLVFLAGAFAGTGLLSRMTRGLVLSTALTAIDVLPGPRRFFARRKFGIGKPTARRQEDENQNQHAQYIVLQRRARVIP